MSKFRRARSGLLVRTLNEFDRAISLIRITIGTAVFSFECLFSRRDPDSPITHSYDRSFRFELDSERSIRDLFFNVNRRDLEGIILASLFITE